MFGDAYKAKYGSSLFSSHCSHPPSSSRAPQFQIQEEGFMGQKSLRYLATLITRRVHLVAVQTPQTAKWQ